MKTAVIKLTSIALALSLTACGTMTGIPSHGGGKRFATEQRLVSASIRSSLKDIDLTPLRGKKVAVVFDIIADEGGGTLSGGRFNILGGVAAGFISSPVTTAASAFQLFNLNGSGTSYNNTNAGGNNNANTTFISNGTNSSNGNFNQNNNGSFNESGQGNASGTNSNSSNGSFNQSNNGSFNESSQGNASGTNSNTSNGTFNQNGSGSNTNNTNMTGSSTGSTTEATTGTISGTSNGTSSSAYNQNANSTGSNTSDASGTSSNTGSGSFNQSNNNQTSGTNTSNTSGTNTNAGSGSFNQTNNNQASGTNASNASGTNSDAGTNSSTGNNAQNGSYIERGNQTGGFNETRQAISNQPSNTRTQTKGLEQKRGASLEYKGLGEYQNMVVPKSDAGLLMGLVRNYMLLNHVQPTTPEDGSAEAIMYVTVDIFGIVRSRFDAYIYNQETLKAETSFEMIAFDRNGNLVLAPRNANREAQYAERYVLWAGPYRTDEKVRKGKGLLVDFSDVDGERATYGADKVDASYSFGKN